MVHTSDYFKKLGEKFTGNYGNFLKLIPTCYQFSIEDKKVIYKALHEAKRLHQNQYRKSGEPYINHPISVAGLLANFGMDATTISAALLHDTIEDTDYTLEECYQTFGSEITNLVDSVTKIGTDTNIPTRNKILDGIERDMRTIAVKAADRLHNMYTLDALKKEKQIEIATETKNFYVPIAIILGISALKDEFQDLCAFYLNNDEFMKIYRTRCNLKEEYNGTLEELSDNIQGLLSENGLAMEYYYRVKNVGSILENLEYMNLPINVDNMKKIDNLLAIKMVLDEEKGCYQAFNLIQNRYKLPITSFNDYIKNPRENGYKSINYNTEYKNADIQLRIRSRNMQRGNDIGLFSITNDNEKKKVKKYLREHLENLKEKETLK